MNKPILLTIYASKYFGEMVALTRERHKRYCELYGYEYMEVHLEPEDLSWKKVALMIDLIKEKSPSHLFYLDADTAIADMSVDLRDALPEWAHVGMVIHPHPSTWALWHWQWGVVYLRGSEAVCDLLARILSLRGTIPDPMNYLEQNIFNYIMLHDLDRQKILVSLPHRWNVNYYNQDITDGVIYGWHGMEDRLPSMKDCVERLEQQ